MDEDQKIIPLNPWIPISSPIDLKHLGKLGEEAGELSSALCRCIIQGIDESEPNTGKLNRLWLQQELADVIANAELNIEHFGLDKEAIDKRIKFKKSHLKRWHGMLNNAS